MYTLVLITQVYFSVTMTVVPGVYTAAECEREAARWVAASRDVPNESEIQTWANRAWCVPVSGGR